MARRTGGPDCRRPSTRFSMTIETPTSVPSSAERPCYRPRWYVQLAVAGWVAAQLLLPLRCLVADRLQRPPRFCWNMYSYQSNCEGGYVAIRPDGSSASLNPFQLFPREVGAFVTFHRDFLPSFHGWLCRGLELRQPEMRLQGEIRCSSAAGDQELLVRRGVDLCEAENFGVIDR